MKKTISEFASGLFFIIKIKLYKACISNKANVFTLKLAGDWIIVPGHLCLF